MSHMLVQIRKFLAEQQSNSLSLPENAQCNAPRPTSCMSGACASLRCSSGTWLPKARAKANHPYLVLW